MKTVKLCIIACALCAAVACGSTPAAKSPSASSHPAAPQADTLVFSNETASSGTLSFLSTSGKLNSSISVTNSDDTFDQSEANWFAYVGLSSALLSSNELTSGGTTQVTEWSYITSDGKAHAIPSSLTSFLNESWDNSGPSRIGSGVYVTSGGTMYCQVTTGNSSAVDDVNLNTGSIRTLFTVTDTSSTPDPYALFFNIENMTENGDQLSFLANHAAINGMTISSPTLIVDTLATNHLAFTTLPEAVGNALNADGSTLVGYASGDGKYVLYQSYAVVNGTNTASMYVYDTATQKSVSVPNVAALVSNSFSVFFSPDDSDIALCNGCQANAMTGDFEIVDATTGHMVAQTAGIGTTGTEELLAAGWGSDGNFYYNLNTTSTPNDFTSFTDITGYQLNPATQAIHSYGTGNGLLVAVLP